MCQEQILAELTSTILCSGKKVYWAFSQCLPLLTVNLWFYFSFRIPRNEVHSILHCCCHGYTSWCRGGALSKASEEQYQWSSTQITWHAWWSLPDVWLSWHHKETRMWTGSNCQQILWWEMHFSVLPRICLLHFLHAKESCQEKGFLQMPFRSSKEDQTSKDKFCWRLCM